MQTRMKLTVALSRVPSSSTPVTVSAMKIAGRPTMPLSRNISGARQPRRHAGQGVDARANDGADAQRHQVRPAQGLLQTPVPVDGLRRLERLRAGDETHARRLPSTRFIWPAPGSIAKPA